MIGIQVNISNENTKLLLLETYKFCLKQVNIYELKKIQNINK